MKNFYNDRVFRCYQFDHGFTRIALAFKNKWRNIIWYHISIDLCEHLLQIDEVVVYGDEHNYPIITGDELCCLFLDDMLGAITNHERLGNLQQNEPAFVSMEPTPRADDHPGLITEWVKNKVFHFLPCSIG